jgi:hypothetical protein
MRSEWIDGDGNKQETNNFQDPSERMTFYQQNGLGMSGEYGLHGLMEMVQRKARHIEPETSNADEAYFTRPNRADQYRLKYE